ncbi:DUF7002 family protein [Paeniroseomonas aquatica]|uniref:DUF7002 family protein n=1 Tax=Paeniroseomonas aquatica TaxID=373043 RepID=UPI003623748B
MFHVTEASALPGIARHGLLSAEALARLLGAAVDLGANRRGWTPLVTFRGAALLRRQGMADAALASRLAPGIDTAAWRRFINAQVFLFPTEAAAWRLRAAEPGRDQAVLAAPTAALLEAGCDLRLCRFNNGYVDRSPPGRRRLRGFADYRPVADWRAGPAPAGAAPREVTVAGAIPPGIAWSRLPASRGAGTPRLPDLPVA